MNKEVFRLSSALNELLAEAELEEELSGGTMTATAVTQRSIGNQDTKLYESLALKGDISALTPQERVSYYAALCDRLGLDPYTQPFLPLRLNGKEILYASKGATDQLAGKHNLTREIRSRERLEDVWLVVARATTPSGRFDESTGAVPIGNLKGESLANALMKAETKAKRRATLSLLGLGMLDESELDTIAPHAMQHPKPTASDIERESLKALCLELMDPALQLSKPNQRALDKAAGMVGDADATSEKMQAAITHLKAVLEKNKPVSPFEAVDREQDIDLAGTGV